MKCAHDARRAHGAISGRVLALIVIAAVIALTALYLFYPEPAPEPIPAPAPEPVLAPPPPLETVAPAQTEEERGDTAREVIAELKAAPGGPDYEAAYARAREFQAAGRLADAQLLYFFAARGGNGPAAFDLAGFYDPNHFSAENSLMEEPDPFQAYKWYSAAADAGNESAQERLIELRAWADEAAGAGDTEAERLLQQWE